MIGKKYFFGGVVIVLLVGLFIGWKYIGNPLDTGIVTPPVKLSAQPSAIPPAPPPTEIRLTPRQPMTQEQAARIKEALLTPEVNQVLTKKEETLQTLATDHAIVDAVRSLNSKDQQLSLADITRLDTDWIASKTATPFIQQFITNETAQRLVAFQKANLGFKEIFAADAYGLVVGETNKTSDYYQADEAWWVNSMNGGAGKIIHGNIEFDQSAQTEAISIYIPIIDPATKTAIGVLKGVLNLSAVKAAL